MSDDRLTKLVRAVTNAVAEFMDGMELFDAETCALLDAARHADSSVRCPTCGSLATNYRGYDVTGGSSQPWPLCADRWHMFAGMMADPRRHPQDWTEAEVRQEFRDWLDERAADLDETPPDGPLNAYEDTDGPDGEDAVRERQYERDHGIEP